MRQEWGSNTNIGIGLSELGRHLLAIVGPSGSGKTAISIALTDIDRATFISPIYTTRPPRTDDTHGYYRHVSDVEFSTFDRDGRFFICRRSPFPSYGWMKDDLVKAVQSRKLAILPFRSGGAKFLLDIIPTMMIVFIEPLPNSSSLHAADRLKTKGEENVQSVIQDNKNLLTTAMAKNWEIKTVQNHFFGVREVYQHAQTIAEWIRERHPTDYSF